MGTYLIHPCTEITTKTDQCLQTKLKYSQCQMQGTNNYKVGWRRAMQDATICQSNLGDGNALFAVFDGHGGNQVSKLAQKIFIQYFKKSQHYKQGNYRQAFIDTFKKIDQFIASSQGEQQMIKIQKQYHGTIKKTDEKISQFAGCTANVVLITPSTYVIANIGDSRSVLLRGDQKTVVLSIDHKPQQPAQRQRILSAGGQVIGGRVNGGLNLTRCLGDFFYKQRKNLDYDRQMITCKPDIKQFARVRGDKFILVGCDGIWEKYNHNSHDLLSKLQKQKMEGKQSLTILREMVQKLLAKDLNEETGCDNMTAILIQFL